ncbi:MAG: hypothetical protein WAV31_05695 [Candidatus Moraniibacteriota bacterium]
MEFKEPSASPEKRETESGMIKIKNEFGENVVRFDILKDGRLVVGKKELLFVLRAVKRDTANYTTVSVVPEEGDINSGGIVIKNETGENKIKFEILNDERIAINEDQLVYVLKAIAGDTMNFSSVSMEKNLHK